MSSFKYKKCSVKPDILCRCASTTWELKVGRYSLGMKDTRSAKDTFPRHSAGRKPRGNLCSSAATWIALTQGANLQTESNDIMISLLEAVLSQAGETPVACNILLLNLGSAPCTHKKTKSTAGRVEALKLDPDKVLYGPPPLGTKEGVCDSSVLTGGVDRTCPSP